MQDLMTEKERVRVEIEKIELNKSLTRQDRYLASKSVRGLSRTIEGLIDREKEKISEKFESQFMSNIASNYRVDSAKKRSHSRGSNTSS
jgi:hypothetical protein